MVVEYDKLIQTHYDQVADQYADSHTSTMEDEIVREKETNIILRILSAYTSSSSVVMRESRDLRLLDVGCGNGFTLETLLQSHLGFQSYGIEPNNRLRCLANTRLNFLGVQVENGDLRKRESLGTRKYDVVISQRTLINLLDLQHQQTALNIQSLLSIGGIYISIEAFNSGLDNLNKARIEFGFEKIEPAHHNLYLEDDFFQTPNLAPWPPADKIAKPNEFSTHYYVSRVLHDVFLLATKSELKRNSEFVKYFSSAMPDGIGDYSPLRVHVLQKIRSDD